MKIIKKYKVLSILGLVDILALVVMFVMYKGLAFIPMCCLTLMNVLAIVLIAVYYYIKGVKEGDIEIDEAKGGISQVLLIVFAAFLPVILEKLLGIL